MYASAVEGLSQEERADFDSRLYRSDVPAPTPVRVVRALPSGHVDEVARARADRIAAIKALGGKVTIGERA